MASNPLGGGVDLSTIPTTLIQRVDVVTGGASATWGSDAVAGVVNLVLNKNFTGIKGSVNYSNIAVGNHGAYKGDLSWGEDFLGGRAHVILSGNYTMSPDSLFIGDTKFWKPVTLIPNPNTAAGQPTYVHVSGVGNAQYTPGGLIVSSAAGPGAAANSLRGIQFTGSAATPSPFNFGSLPITNGNCYGCSGNDYSDVAQWAYVAVPYHNTTMFGYGSYKITPDIQASVQVNFGENFEENTAADRKSALTIKSDNAFIPSAIQQRMVAAGITSFTLDTDNENNINPKDLSSDSLENSLGYVFNQNTRQLMRGVFTLDGAIGDDWSWTAYVQHSQIRETQHNPNNTVTSNYNNATDAVTVTAANVGTSGLPIGSIQCRTTLTNTANGCVPLDVFGTGNFSQAAINYVAPGYWAIWRRWTKSIIISSRK